MIDRIIEIIKDICLLENNEFVMDKQLRGDLMISSLDYVKLITIIEDEFGFEMPDDTLVLEEDMSVSDLIDMVLTQYSQRR